MVVLLLVFGMASNIDLANFWRYAFIPPTPKVSYVNHLHARSFPPENFAKSSFQIWEGHKQILRSKTFRLVPFSAQTDITKVQFHQSKVSPDTRKISGQITKIMFFSCILLSEGQTSQDSSGSQVEEPCGPSFTSKFLQKWQIDFEPNFTPSPDISHQIRPHSDLRHTSKYRFLKFSLKMIESSHVFGRSKWRGVYTTCPELPQLGLPQWSLAFLWHLV